MYSHMVGRKIGYLLMGAVCLFLLGASALGQQTKPPCLKLKERIYWFDAVRQGDFYDVALRLEAHGCVLSVTPDLTPEESSWRAEPGGTLQADQQSFVGRPLPDIYSQSREVTLTVRISAPSEAEVGKHTVHGVVHYRAVGVSATREEQVEVDIPVKVVSTGATVHARKVDADGDLKWYQIVILIVAFPIAFLIYGANEC